MTTHLVSRFVLAGRCSQQRAAVAASDDGTGVDPSSSSGLGIAIADWVARAHGDSVALASASPGATFVARLPVFAR